MPETDQNKHLKAINDALSKKDVRKLRHLSGKGLVNNSIRRQVWPLLLGVKDVKNNSNSKEGSSKNLENSDEGECKSVGPYSLEYQKSETYIQVKKDTERSMYQFDITKKYDKEERLIEQKRLEAILHGIFCHNPDLHYTQGFHDICTVFYIVCGEKLGRQLSENLAKRHLRDMVRDNLTVFQYISQLLFPLVSLVDFELFEFLSKSQCTPFFSLSWLLTWFAHNIEKFDDICRLYDLFLASHPLMPMYFSVSLIQSVKESLFQVECEFAMVHKFFSQFSWDINFDEIIDNCLRIFNKYPPLELYKAFCINDLKDKEKLHLKNLPTDSPFLAKNVDELENMKKKYSGQKLLKWWYYENPKFWKVIVLPALTAMAVAYCVHSWGNGVGATSYPNTTDPNEILK